MSINAGTIQAELTLNTGKYDDNMKRAELQMTKFADKMQTMGKRMDKIGGEMTKKVTLPIVGIGTAALKVAADFESSMSEVAAISGATGDKLAALEAKAREMGSTTKFSASESAQALKYMAMAGWETEQMLDGLEGVMLLAAASGEDLAMVSDIVTDALTAFGMKASQAAEFADLLASASSSSNTNVAMLGESFKYVAPLFGALNYSAEDAALALGLMANAGIKGSQSGTVLRAAINRLVAPVGEAGELIERLGISVTDASGEMLPFRDLLVQLREKFADLSEEQQAQYASALFGQQAMAGMLAIINASEEDFNKLTIATREYNGAAKRMADIMEDNLKGSLTRLRSKIEEVGLKLSDTLLPMAERAIAVFERWVDWFDKLDASTKESIVKFGLLAAAIGPALSAIGKMSMGVSTLTGLLVKYGTVTTAASAVSGTAAFSIKTLATSFGLLAAKVTLVVGAVWLFYEAVKDAKKGQDSLGAASGILGYNMQNLKRDIDNINTSLKQQTVEYQRVAAYQAMTQKSVENYTDSIEAQRLKGQQAIQQQETAKRKLQELEDAFNKAREAVDLTSTGIEDNTKALKKNAEEMKNAAEAAQELENKLKLVYGAYRKIDASPKSIISKYMADYINRTGDISVAFNARGTDYWRGGWTWVGEEGPELMRLPAGTQIISSDKSMDMVMNAIASLNMGVARGTERSQPVRGGDIHQHITINSPQPLSASEIARKTLQISRQLAMEWGL